MILCPNCQISIGTTEIRNTSCNGCGFRPSMVDSIPLFAPNYRLTFKDHTPYAIRNLIRHADNHFWLISRRKVITEKIASFLNDGESFLEVGSGAADIPRELQNRGIKVTVSDIQIDGLIHAANHNIGSVVQFDLYNPIYRNHFDAVGAFCVIEHLDHDLTAVKHLVDIVKPGGFVFVMVPAHRWLWNNRDRLEGHKRRYSRKTLTKLFENVDATVINVDYMFFSILPLFLGRSLLDLVRNKNSFSPEDHETSMNINPIANHLLLKLMDLENLIFKKRAPPFGCSLILTARKCSSV